MLQAAAQPRAAASSRRRPARGRAASPACVLCAARFHWTCGRRHGGLWTCSESGLCAAPVTHSHAHTRGWGGGTDESRHDARGARAQPRHVPAVGTRGSRDGRRGRGRAGHVVPWVGVWGRPGVGAAAERYGRAVDRLRCWPACARVLQVSVSWLRARVAGSYSIRRKVSRGEDCYTCVADSVRCRARMPRPRRRQGLAFAADGRLFESCGLYMHSSLRELDPVSMSVLRSTAVDPKYFGAESARGGSGVLRPHVSPACSRGHHHSGP